MQASIFETLEHVRPTAKYSLPVSKRITILENNIRELEKYHSKAGKNKQAILSRLIDRYTILLNKLSKG